MTTTWHVPPATLDRYADAGAAMEPVTAASVEAHLASCATCRRALAASTDDGDLERSWAAIADVVDRPRQPVVERVLGALGLPDGVPRLLAATPALRTSSLAALVLVVAATALVARESGHDGVFLVTAPLLPLLAAVGTFATVAEPAGETGAASPLAGAGLVARRAVAVLGTAFLLLGAAAALLGTDDASTAAAWVLPALALATGALALGLWVPIERAALGLAATWCGAVPLGRLLAGPGRDLADSAAFGLGGQVVAAAAAATALAVLVGQRAQLGCYGVRR